MYRLIEFIVRFKEYFSLCAIVVICFSLMFMSGTERLGGFRTIVIGGLGWLQNAFAWVPNPVALKSENEALRTLNLQLVEERSRIRQAITENEKLRKLLEFKKISTTPLVAAEVVGKTTAEIRNYATLNKGMKDGIAQGMPVITDAGLVGVVTGASSGYSIVRLLINRDMKVAAKVERSRIDGILAWEGGQGLSMRNIPKSYDIKVGDEVSTSGYSSKFPANIPIGKIVSIADDPTSLFQKVDVMPHVNFLTLEQVFVSKVIPDPERSTMEQRIEEMVKSKGRR